MMGQSFAILLETGEKCLGSSMVIETLLPLRAPLFSVERVHVQAAAIDQRHLENALQIHRAIINRE